MEYQRAVNAELNTFNIHEKESPNVGWHVMMYGHLVKAVAYALLDIAQAIREHTRHTR